MVSAEIKSTNILHPTIFADGTSVEPSRVATTAQYHQNFVPWNRHFYSNAPSPEPTTAGGLAGYVIPSCPTSFVGISQGFESAGRTRLPCPFALPLGESHNELICGSKIIQFAKKNS